MSPNEISILRIFQKADTAGKGMISKRLGVSTDYAEYLCKSLFRKGYLEVIPRGQYRLTQKGLSALVEDLVRFRDELKRKMVLLHEHIEMTELTLARLKKSEGLPAE